MEGVQVATFWTRFVILVSSLLRDFVLTESCFSSSFFFFPQQHFLFWVVVCLFAYGLSGEEKQTESFLALI